MKLKRIISSVLAALMLASVAVTGASAWEAIEGEEDKFMSFSDVSESNWFYDAVKYVFDRDLMEGKGEGKFAPTESLTRAQFVTIIGRLAGVEADRVATDTFSDTKKDTWYSPYVGWAVETGIVTGYSDNTFRPNKTMPRQEMAVVISRYIESEGIAMPRENTAPAEFTDVDTIASWAAEHVEVLRRAGIVSGKGGDNFEPTAQVKRSETAQIIMNLIEAEAKVWQGYTPETDGESIIFGAKYMYWSGPLVAGELATELSENRGYPVLEAYDDGTEAAVLPEGSVGVSFSAFGHTYADYPIVKICYSMENTALQKPELWFGVNNVHTGTPTAVSEGEDEGFTTVTVSIADIIAANPDIDNDIYLTQFLLMPFTEEDTADARLQIRYIGLFKNEADAAAFKSADMADYLKNYYLYSPVELVNITDEEIDGYNELITARINEILTSESAFTPDDFPADKVRYISANGDDDADGLTPETAWRTGKNLTATKAGGLVTYSSLEAGSAVFFERGSVWYPEKYYNNYKGNLGLWGDLYYGAYGEGDKPLFTGAIDFTDKNGGTGVWLETEWENVYVLDQIDENPDFCGYRADIGIIVFDGGKATGVRVVPQVIEDIYTDENAYLLDETDHFAPGTYTIDRGFCCNGLTYYYSGVKSCENPGTALTNDLEFLHDCKEGKLYLYCEGGNPSDRFEDIKVGTKSYVVSCGEENVWADNLAARYSCWGLLDFGGGNNVKITNCEAGWSCGSLSSVDGSIGGYGSVNGYLISNCYSHDIGDGCTTHQNSNPQKGENIVDVTYENNVFVCSGAGIETWLHTGEIYEDGSARNYLQNVNVVNNIIAYIGYGVNQKQAFQSTNEGGAIDGSVYGEYIDCSIEDNLILFTTGTIIRANVHSDNVDVGWNFKDNVYVGDSSTAFLYHFETIHRMLNHNMEAVKRCRTSYPYSERYIKYYTSQGIGTTGEFYYDSRSLSEAESRGCFYINGYYLQNGIYEIDG